MVYNNLFCLGLLDDVKALLAEKGVDIAILEDIEDDAFGNGGFGPSGSLLPLIPRSRRTSR